MINLYRGPSKDASYQVLIHLARLTDNRSRKKQNILNRQHIASQWGLQLIFRMHNSDPTPQGVENRNILLSLQ